MARYVAGFVVPIPKKNLSKYLKVAKACQKIWKEYGALDYVECVADDVKPGKLTSFPQSVRLKKNEVVIFSWITYKSRAHRDKVNKKVMNDPRMKMDDIMKIFDAKRMIYGGFKTSVE